MTSRIAIVSCAVGILVGISATWLLARSPEAPRDPQRPEQVARDGRGERTAPIQIGSGTGAKAAEIRALVGEEVRAALREQAADGTAGDAAAEAAGHEPASPSAAFEQVRNRVSERIARGSWTPGDRDWMRSALGTVNDAERTELIRRVIVAANSGAMRVDLEGPLF